MIILNGHSNPVLGGKIAQILNAEVGDCDVTKFADGELNLKNSADMRGKDVAIVQSISQNGDWSVNDSLVELLMMGKSAHNGGARSISAVIPYFGYARQDRTVDYRDCITAALVAEMVENAGFRHVLTIDLHSQQIQGFFHKCVVQTLSGSGLILDYFRGKMDDDCVVVAPDEGSFKNSFKLSQELGIPLCFVGKNRTTANVSQVVGYYGDVAGKTCFIQDDIIDTAGTICNSAENLKERGAKKVYVATTHGVLSSPAIERLEASHIDEIVFLDTIHIPEEKQLPKMKVLSVAGLIAENMGFVINL